MEAPRTPLARPVQNHQVFDMILAFQIPSSVLSPRSKSGPSSSLQHQKVNQSLPPVKEFITDTAASTAFNLSSNCMIKVHFRHLEVGEGTSQGGRVVNNPPANAGNTRDTGSVPGSGRFPGEGNGNPLQYSCLENSMDRGVWWPTVHGVAKSWTQLSD